MQRNPHSYQIATGYRTFYSLSLIYQPITKKRLFFIEKDQSTLIEGVPKALIPIFGVRTGQFWDTFHLLLIANIP